MMSSWSARRKLVYVSTALAILLFVIILPAYLILYRAPTCFDNKKNGDETGIDCGGSCQRLCSFEALPPTVLWSRAFKVSSGNYNAVAYIENSNINSESVASYKFTFFDENNVQIAERSGSVYLQKNKIFAVFEPAVVTGEKIPKRVSFEFTETPTWKKNENKTPEVVVVEKRLSKEDSVPRIDGVILNKELVPVSNVEVTAIVYDDAGNAIGASRTYVDSIKKESSVPVVFTWPEPFVTSQNVCKVKSGGAVSDIDQKLGVMLALDRSGSMTSLGKSPPQPLTDVKVAAGAFVNALKDGDEAGLVSFATEASNPIDAKLTPALNSVKKSIDKLSIIPSGTQYTNLGDGIASASSELLSRKDISEKVIILLTDGIASAPTKQGDNNYPENYAVTKAGQAKTDGIKLYIIGLGNEVNKKFLEGIATAPDHYFEVATAGNLEEIYKKIAVQICTHGPSVIEIIPRVLPAR